MSTMFAAGAMAWAHSTSIAVSVDSTGLLIVPLVAVHNPDFLAVYVKDVVVGTDVTWYWPSYSGTLASAIVTSAPTESPWGDVVVTVAVVGASVSDSVIFVMPM